jgi:hypothetical protein
MKNKKGEPKFKVGDVVEVNSRGRCAIEGARGKVTNVEQMTMEEIVNGEFYGLPNGEFYAYDFEWFEHPDCDEWGIESWFRFCKGTRNRKLCSECEHYQICPKSPLNCKTGGKLDAKHCNECNNRFKCWTNRR